MKKLLAFFLITIVVAVISVFSTPGDSQAIPAFARQTGQSCNLCHYQFPKLNELGIVFKNNGYRMPGTSARNVWELKTIPLAGLIRLEGESTWGKDVENETTILAESFKVLLATPIKDHFSVFAVMEHESGENVHFAAVASVDNLTGTLGRLNIRGGNHVPREWDHFSQMRRVLSSNYLAADTIGIIKMFSMGGFGSGEIDYMDQYYYNDKLIDTDREVSAKEGSAGIEAYGQIIGKGSVPTYRYKLGLHTDPGLLEDKSSKIAGGWGVFTLTLAKKHSLGLMYAYDEEPEDELDINTIVQRFGANVEFNVPKTSIILGWNRQKRDDYEESTEDLTVNNYVAEVLYMATSKLLLGIREDYVEANQGGADGNINRLTVGAYKYFLPNAKIGVEYAREERDKLAPGMGHTMGQPAHNSIGLAANETRQTAKLIFEIGF